MLTIDLRSDTFTKPTASMRKAMESAEVGDDVYGEDPSVQKLETKVAHIFKKEAALFFPTATMCNLCAVSVWCNERGCEAILGDMSHIACFEQGGIATVAGIFPRMIPNEADGSMNIESIHKALQAPANPHLCATKVICLENTHTKCGGTILCPVYVKRVRELANKFNIRMHLDGSRVFNAAVKSKTLLSTLTEDFDSITICFSKGLCAPVGAALIGTQEFIHTARRIRKVYGGSMRQSGVLAAACVVALDEMIPALLHDHSKAQIFADYIHTHTQELYVHMSVHTNMVVVKLMCDGLKVLQALKDGSEDGVCVKCICFPDDHTQLRATFHHDVCEPDALKAAVPFTKNTILAKITQKSELVDSGKELRDEI